MEVTVREFHLGDPFGTALPDLLQFSRRGYGPSRVRSEFTESGLAQPVVAFRASEFGVDFEADR
jgi:hypothetical protein